jgi:16S rRNA (cytidine1402-2'-O)-methyltransferase
MQCLVFGRITQSFGGCRGSWSGWKETHVSASFTSALAAAHAAAGDQHYPQGALYVVATPIGNLADISLRALHVLQLADRIACEDTRHTQSLLRAYGIEKNGAQLLAVHQHNEQEAAQTVVALLQQGLRVAYVSDAGTPGVSDPGARLVTATRAQGLRTIPLPGSSSVTTAVSVAGIAADSHQEHGFVFAGFLPSKSGERSTAVQALAREARAVVLLEAPHRIEALAEALAALGARLITVGRELTKQFEEIATVPCDGLKAWLAVDSNRLRGEFALVLHPTPVAASSGKDTQILKLLMAELPLKTAVKLAAEISGESKNALYDLALELKEGR